MIQLPEKYKENSDVLNKGCIVYTQVRCLYSSLVNARQLSGRSAAAEFVLADCGMNNR
jgi:hypothetical protein